MNKKYCLYYHINPLKNQIFYVGIGSIKRASDKRGRNAHWQSTVEKYGYIIDIAYTDLTREEAIALEVQQIKFIGRRDQGKGTLVNLTDGGDGLINVSEQTRLKMKESYFKYALENPDYMKARREKMKGRKQSEKEKKKRADSNRGRKRSEEFVQKLAEHPTGNNKKSVIQYTSDGCVVAEFASLSSAAKSCGTTLPYMCTKIKNCVPYKGHIYKYK